MSKLIECFEQNSSFKDNLLETYGLSCEEKFDCVFVAPCWSPDKIFDVKEMDIEQIFECFYATTYRIRHKNKNYAFVVLQIGAPNMIDFCLLCYRMKCDHFVFVGSVGALVPEINVGEIIVPQCAISANGATLYLAEDFKQKKMFEKSYACLELCQQVREIFYKKGINTLDVPVVSVDSIIAEYVHLDEFRNMGAKVIEMEVATFFASLNYIGKSGVALLVVSDNSSTGTHLIGRTEEDKINYYKSRSQLAEILLEM